MKPERERAFIIHFVYFFIIFVLVAVALKYVLPLLMPFVLAFVIAYVLRRPTEALSGLLRCPARPVALLLVLAFYGIIGLLAVLLVGRAVAEAQTLLGFLPHFYKSGVEPALMEVFAAVENFVLEKDASLFQELSRFESQLIDWLGTMISSVSGKAVSMASGFAYAVPGLFIETVLMVISTFFIAADYDRLVGFCAAQLNENVATLFCKIREYVIGTLFVCIRSYAIIMSLTFAELSVGLTVIGMEHALLISFCIAVFDILPVLGTGGIMIPWALITLVRGEYSLALRLVVLYVIITIIRNIVEPKIVGSQLGLHPVVTLASMFAGLQLLGGVGLFGFPIALSLLCYLNDGGVVHVFRKPEEKP